MSDISRFIIRTIMGSLTSQFSSANQALRYVRETLKLSIRTKDFYDMWREATGREKVKDAFETLRMDYRLSKENIPVATINLKNNYLWQVEYEVEIRPGYWERRYLSFYTYDIPTKREVIARATSFFEDAIERDPEKYKPVRIKRIGCLRRK
jgi:hypothetical protein